MKRTIFLCASMAIVLGMSMALSACGQSPIDKAEDNFVSGCQQGGAPTSTCACVFDKMVDTYGKDQMVAIARSDGKTIPPNFGKVLAGLAIECRQST